MKRRAHLKPITFILPHLCHCQTLAAVPTSTPKGEKSEHYSSDPSLPRSNQSDILPQHTQISRIGHCCLNSVCSTTWLRSQRSLPCILLFLQQFSGGETQTSPTLPALAEGLIRQAQLSEAICQTTELLVGCLDAVSCPYVYWAATACANPTLRKNQSMVWDVYIRTNFIIQDS